MTKPARDWERDWKLCQRATPGPWYPRASVEDGKWDENTEFIAEAREALPYWLQRVKELEGALKLAYKALTEGMKDVPTEACDPQCAKIRVEAKKAIRKALKRMTENDRARNSVGRTAG